MKPPFKTARIALSDRSDCAYHTRLTLKVKLC
jgi:hypothetical protein